MKRILKSLVVALTIFSIVATLFSGITCFAASTGMRFSGHTINVGDTFTVTLTITADSGKQIMATYADLKYDSQVLQYKGASGATANGATNPIKLSSIPSGVTTNSFTVSFTAIAPGKSSIALSNVIYVPTDSDDEISVSGQSATVTVAEPTPPTTSTPDNTDEPEKPSNNANLSSLKVSGATLSPAFKATTTKYTAKVKSDVEKVTITGNAIDGGTCEGLGTFNIKDGENVRYITVTAADGKTKKTYTVTIIRGEETDEPDEPETPADPLAVKIGDADYTVIAEAPAAIPAGFTADTAMLGETEVGVLKSADGKIVLYTLKANESGSTDYYTYDKAKNEFSLLKYGVINGKMYVFTDTKSGSAKGYKNTELNLGNSTVNAYKSTDSKLSDFYIIYCYVDGKYGYYSYDSVENTIQRAPTFKLAGDNKSEAEKEVISSIKDLPKLSTEGKAIIIILAIIVICIILLIVLVIVRFVKLRKIIDEDNFDLEDGNNLFDEVHIEDTSKNTEDDSRF